MARETDWTMVASLFCFGVLAGFVAGTFGFPTWEVAAVGAILAYPTYRLIDAYYEPPGEAD